MRRFAFPGTIRPIVSRIDTKTWKTVAYYLSFVVIGVTTASIGPSIPSFAENIGASLAITGTLFVFHRIGYMLGSLGGGALFDRVAPKFVISTAMVVVGAGLLLLPQWRQAAGIFATILFVGLAQGTTEVGANTGIVRLHGERAGPLMNGLHLSFGIGAILSPLLVSRSVARLGSLQPSFTLFALIAGVLFLFWLLLPGGVVQRTGEKSPGAEAQRLLVVLFSVLFFMVIAGEAGFAGWIYSYSVESGLVRAEVAGYLTSAFWTALTVGRFVGIELTRRMGAKRLLHMSLAGCVASMALFLVSPHNLYVLWAVTTLFGLSQASAIPAAFTVAGNAKVLTGSVGGVFVASSSAGGMLAPWIIGHLFESIGPIAMVWLLSATQLMAFAAFLGIRPRVSRSG